MEKRIECVDNYTALSLISSALMSVYYSGSYTNQKEPPEYMETIEDLQLKERVDRKSSTIREFLSYIIVKSAEKKKLRTLVQDYSLTYSENIISSVIGTDNYKLLLDIVKSYMSDIADYYGISLLGKIVNYLCSKSKTVKFSFLDYLKSLSLYELIDSKEV